MSCVEGADRGSQRTSVAGGEVVLCDQICGKRDRIVTNIAGLTA
jgi:hypothetical protein